MAGRTPPESRINLQDPIGKLVGKRRVGDAFEYGMKLQKAGASLRQAFQGGTVPKGVHRFRTFEEADAWLTRSLARRRT